MIFSFETEAFDSGQGRNDNVGLVGGTGPIVAIQFKARGTCTGKQTLWTREADLLTCSHVVGATIGCTCRGWIIQIIQCDKHKPKSGCRYIVSLLTFSIVHFQNSESRNIVSHHDLISPCCLVYTLYDLKIPVTEVEVVTIDSYTPGMRQARHYGGTICPIRITTLNLGIEMLDNIF